MRSLAKSLENWLLTAMNGCPEDIIIIVKVWEIKRNYILQMGNILFCVCLIGGRHLGLIPTFGKRINWEICPRWLASFCSNGRFTGTTTTTNQLKINGLRNIEFVFSVWWWFVRLLPCDSFGSFHLIRLLYDGEYIFYLVEHRVAMVTVEFVNMTLRRTSQDRRHHYSAVCPV